MRPTSERQMLFKQHLSKHSPSIDFPTFYFTNLSVRLFAAQPPGMVDRNHSSLYLLPSSQTLTATFFFVLTAISLPRLSICSCVYDCRVFQTPWGGFVVVLAPGSWQLWLMFYNPINSCNFLQLKTQSDHMVVPVEVGQSRWGDIEAKNVYMSKKDWKARKKQWVKNAPQLKFPTCRLVSFPFCARYYSLTSKRHCSAALHMQEALEAPGWLWS